MNLRPFRVVTWNLMCPVAQPLRYNGQSERITRIPAAILSIPGDPVDVIVVQESINPKLHQQLSDGLKDIGYMYTTKPLKGSLLTGKIVHGGVALFSRHPILEEDSIIFDSDCEGSDCLSSKGAVFIRIRLGQNHLLSIVGTHLHAWETSRARKIRVEQSLAIRKLINKQKISSAESLLVVGDFNVDRYTQKDQLQKLRDILGCRGFKVKDDPDFRYTSDPKTNSLVGNDADKAYANEMYPNGCYQEYLQTLHSPCAPREWLDYVHFSSHHMKPKNHSMRILPLKSPTPFEIKLNMNTTRMIRDLSDHYPVIGECDIHPATPLALRIAKNKTIASTNSDEELAWWIWVLIAVAGVLLIIGGVWLWKKYK
jgi:endonuclease/exonuclease/phosphatase family metal-dependent hydrolase